MQIDLLCLANSNKWSGRCIAGIRLDTGAWLRPISPRAEHGQLSQGEIRLNDGSDPQVLDVIQVQLAEPRPSPGHPEDWIIARTPWKLRSRPAGLETLNILNAALEQGPHLLGSRGARVPLRCAERLNASLAVVKPSNLRWRLDEMCKPRAVSELGRQSYDLPLTDPAWTARVIRGLADLPPGEHPSAAVGALLTISLSEPYGEYCYKLAAGVVALKRKGPSLARDARISGSEATSYGT